MQSAIKKEIMKITYSKNVEVEQEITVNDIDAIIIKAIQYKKSFISQNGEVKTDIYYMAQLPSPFSMKYDSQNQKLEFTDAFNNFLLNKSCKIRIINKVETLMQLKFKIYCHDKFYPNKFGAMQIEDLAKQYGLNGNEAKHVIKSIQEWSEAIHYTNNHGNSVIQYAHNEYYEWKQEFIKSHNKEKYF
jgi:gamma-glutamyl phosphate reductase